MPMYLVDRDLPGVDADGLEAIHQVALAACRQFCDAGQSIQYRQSVFIPGEQRCLCLFEAGDETVVGALNEAAGLSFTRIVAALRFSPEGNGTTTNTTGR
jgi:hypothetical protein